MKIQFFYNRVTKQFYIEAMVETTFVAGNISPSAAVDIVNLLLGGLRASASNPEALPRDIAIADTPLGTFVVQPVGEIPES